METESSSLLHLIYEENSFWIFVLVTIVLGGGAAWLTGRAVAGTWRPAWQVFVYCLILGGAVRFIDVRILGLSGGPRVADGHPLSLDQRSRRAFALAPPQTLT